MRNYIDFKEFNVDADSDGRIIRLKFTDRDLESMEYVIEMDSANANCLRHMLKHAAKLVDG